MKGHQVACLISLIVFLLLLTGEILVGILWYSRYTEEPAQGMLFVMGTFLVISFFVCLSLSYFCLCYCLDKSDNNQTTQRNATLHQNSTSVAKQSSSQNKQIQSAVDPQMELTPYYISTEQSSCDNHYHHNHPPIINHGSISNNYSSSDHCYSSGCHGTSSSGGGDCGGGHH